uniref:Uncharacterized protein n=1 Tax=Anopheles farauti TaxID=69004 RepID=A0A182PZU3_9DIPT
MVPEQALASSGSAEAAAAATAATTTTFFASSSTGVPIVIPPIGRVLGSSGCSWWRPLDRIRATSFNDELLRFFPREAGASEVTWNTVIESGSASPMAYATCTRHRRQMPAFTSDFATHRAAYAADRSTFVKSLPEKAPPPCAPQPPYVSTMILRPVRPASPCGPPMMNNPHGLMCTIVFASKYLAGITSLITLSIISLRSSSSVILSECCRDTTTVCTRCGMHAPDSNTYSAVT